MAREARPTAIRSGKDRPKKARIFNCVQYEYDPIAEAMGQPRILFSFDEKTIQEGLAHESIVRYGYIRHDKDQYHENDLIDLQAKADAHAKKEHLPCLPDGHYPLRVRAGDPKPPHWHLVLECKYSLTPSTIADWFQLPENQVDVPSGKNAFLDCLEYLQHSDIKQRDAGKHPYEPDDIRTNVNWNEISYHISRRTRYGSRISDRDWYRNEVAAGRMKPLDVMRENPTAYSTDVIMLEKLRGRYLSNLAPLPEFRLNLYIEGSGGSGKGLSSFGIARNLFPDLPPQDIYFEAGNRNVTFEGYDGQPVIIWSDVRASELMRIFGGRGELFAFLDPYPQGRKRQNIKNAYTLPINCINIINSVQPYQQFLDELAGEYKDRAGILHAAEDRKQSYRRFPLIYQIGTNMTSILINSGWASSNGDFLEYSPFSHVQGSLRQLADRCHGDRAFFDKLSVFFVRSLADPCRMLMQQNKPHDATDKRMLLREIRGSGFGLAYSNEDLEEAELQRQVTEMEMADADRDPFAKIQQEIDEMLTESGMYAEESEYSRNYGELYGRWKKGYPFAACTDRHTKCDCARIPCGFFPVCKKYESMDSGDDPAMLDLVHDYDNYHFEYDKEGYVYGVYGPELSDPI